MILRHGVNMKRCIRSGGGGSLRTQILETYDCLGKAGVELSTLHKQELKGLEVMRF
jgi:hypothetical protein